MKTSRTLMMIFIFITATSSCNSDDNEINQTHELVGRWQRGDVRDNGEYTLAFLPNYSGYWADIVLYPPDYETGIGGAEGFTWSTTDNPKTLIIPEMELNTPYSINAEGQLILNNFKKGEPFNKIE